MTAVTPAAPRVSAEQPVRGGYGPSPVGHLLHPGVESLAEVAAAAVLMLQQS